MKKYTFILALCAALTACGSTKSIQSSKTTTQRPTSTTQIEDNSKQQQLYYVRKVNDNAVYAKNIVSDIGFEINAMGNNISLGGELQMRRDECIRINVTYTMLITLEVARLEFTPDYVLIMDRYHKQYVKASYNDVDFLKNNGIDFYTLQSLFWNELFMPGKKSLSDGDLSTFTTDLTVKENRPITLSTGKFNFNWQTDVSNALINNTTVNYGKGTAEASTMSFAYSDFVPVGTKKFPSKETLSFNSKAVNKGKMSLTLSMERISTDASWDPHTSVPSSYTQVSAEELLKSIVNFKL